MKYLVMLIILVGCNQRGSDIGYFKGKVISHNHDAYAEWGTAPDGSAFEHRFEMVVVQFDSVGDSEKQIGIVRMWFDGSSPPLPKIGDDIRIPTTAVGKKYIPVDIDTLYITDVQLETQ